MGCRNVELGCLLTLSRRSCGDELGSHREHCKDQRNESTIYAVFLELRKRPEMLVVGVKCLPMDHGIDWVNAVEVTV